MGMYGFVTMGHCMDISGGLNMPRSTYQRAPIVTQARATGIYYNYHARSLGKRQHPNINIQFPRINA